jgi:hypothetical protein
MASGPQTLPHFGQIHPSISLEYLFDQIFETGVFKEFELFLVILPAPPFAASPCALRVIEILGREPTRFLYHGVRFMISHNS